MLNCDVLVVGAGPAGIAAAVRAAGSGLNVTLLDDNPAPGGQIWRGSASNRWFRRLAATQVQVISGAHVISALAGSRTLTIDQGGSTRQVQFGKLIIATGARELFVPFPGWTLPGVMGVGGLQAMAKSGMPISGKRIVVGGSGPLLLAVASHLQRMGADVLFIAEQASLRSVSRFAASLWRFPRKIGEAVVLRASLAKVPYRLGCAVISASGQQQVEAVTYIQAGKRQTVACDYVAVAYGLCPNIELASAFGCSISQRAIAVDDWQRTSLTDTLSAGECTGIGGVDLSLLEGQIAGYVVAGNLKAARRLFPARARARRFAHALDAAFALRPEISKLPRPDTIVCRCEDVTLARLQPMASFRAAKLHTRCGMGPCQARVCGPALHLLFGWQTDSVRPPTFPARIGSLIADEDHHNL